MADRDPAFLWETEALRDSASTPPAPGRGPSPSDWLTLRQAGDATGITVTTLRNWARKGRVPTMLDQTPDGPRRLVSLQGVRARARRLGHEPESREPAAVGSPPAPMEQTSPPPGTMLVPIDAWDKMLLQLGNLHQAGQQLAEARERAARAETEAAFLRERLAELRADHRPETTGLERGEQAGPVEEEAEPTKRSRMPSFTAYLWRIAVSDRRRR